MLFRHIDLYIYVVAVYAYIQFQIKCPQYSNDVKKPSLVVLYMWLYMWFDAYQMFMFTHVALHKLNIIHWKDY